MKNSRIHRENILDEDFERILREVAAPSKLRGPSRGFDDRLAIRLGLRSSNRLDPFVSWGWIGALASLIVMASIYISQIQVDYESSSIGLLESAYTIIGKFLGGAALFFGRILSTEGISPETALSYFGAVLISLVIATVIYVGNYMLKTENW